MHFWQRIISSAWFSHLKVIYNSNKTVTILIVICKNVIIRLCWSPKAEDKIRERFEDKILGIET